MPVGEDPGADDARCRSLRSRERPRGLCSRVHWCERPRLLENGNPQREQMKQFMLLHFVATVLSRWGSWECPSGFGRSARTTGISPSPRPPPLRRSSYPRVYLCLGITAAARTLLQCMQSVDFDSMMWNGWRAWTARNRISSCSCVVSEREKRLAGYLRLSFGCSLELSCCGLAVSL